jgi:BirA family biotin operon repressor/biotin-[acetyl-CoA-carboxylase] ligase
LAIRIFFSTDDNVGVVSTPEQIWPNATSILWPEPWRVTVVAETSSTNADLVAAAESGAVDRTVILAAHQTAGRGRMDRTWEAEPGSNLLVSMLFRKVPEHPVELTHRVGLAAIDACRAVAGVQPELKWPNDLLLGGRKLAGILAQRCGDGSVVVGLGLNVGWAPEGAACLGQQVSVLEVLRAVLVAIDQLPERIDDRYRDALGTLGRRVSVELPVGEVKGTAVDVDSSGQLVVVDTCGITHRFSVGDVVHLRPEVPPPGVGPSVP